MLDLYYSPCHDSQQANHQPRPVSGVEELEESMQYINMSILHLQEQVQKSDRINSDPTKNICTDFTKASLEIRARVISRGLITFLRRSEVSNLS